MAPAARLVLLLLACAPLGVVAQEQHASEEAELERRLQNPLPDLMILQVFSTVDSGIGAEGENRTIVNAQALLPVRVSPNWNVLSWTQVLIESLPVLHSAGVRINGIGDTTQYLLVEPARASAILWGAGAVALLPTATHPELGAGTFGFGPAGLFCFQKDWWTVSLLANHLRSVAGAAGRREVERTYVKPVVSYEFPGGAAVGLESEITLDWGAPAGERWIVPLQLSLSRVTLVGPIPLNLQFGARWYPVSPTGGPTWGLRLAISLLVSINREEGAGGNGEEQARSDSQAH